MKIRRVIIALCLVMMILMGVCQVASASGKQPDVPLTEQGQKLLTTYTQRLNALKEEIKRLEPKLDEKKKAEFTKQFGSLRNVPPVTNIVMGKEVIVKYGPGNPAFAEKQKEVLTAARAVMKDIEAFLVDEKELAIMAKFALLTHATPNRLAGFAQKGEEEKTLIDNLLNDDKLVVQVMKMGGASGGRYGQAMRNYTAIQKAAERSGEGFFQVWALAVSLQYTGDTYIYPGVPAEESLVKYYLNYLKAYDDGILDPAFSKLGGTGWNYRFVFPDSYTLEDIDWIRKVLRNYRPDHTRIPYTWRYCRIVRTDIPYTSGVDRSSMPAELSNIQKYFLEGGICGPRAFVGQVSCYAFGIPSRRAPSPGHGAMAHWTPDGWTTVLGPHFNFCRVNGMPGMEFLLESQARQNPEGFKQVLMCDWLGKALGEDDPGDYGSSGGFWRLLGFYKRQAIVEDQKIEDIGATGAELAESNEEAAAEEIPQIELTEADKTIVVGKDGVITIPVAACRSPKSIEKIRFMKSIDGKSVQMHYNLAGNRPELLKYSFEVPKEGEYEFTAHVVTLTVDRACLLRLNRRTMVDIPLPYTCGMWKDTKPVIIKLKEGKNRFDFTCKAPNKGLTIKYFTLTPVGLSASSASSSTESSTGQAFTFAQICDTQLGMGGYDHDLKTFKQTVDQINELKTDLVVICGDLVGQPDEKSYADFNAIKAQFNVPCYCVPGNHDVGNKPTPESLEHYRKSVGKDYYSFEHKGYVFVCVNTQLWKAPVDAESEKQDSWLKATLENAAKRKLPIFIVGHHPLFAKQMDEDEEYYNLPVEKRKELLLLFEKCGVVAVLTGHAHGIIINQYNGIQLVTGQATSRTNGSPLGFRLWHVTDSRPLIHESVDLEGF